ncbi:unnamed protein product, partial [Ectocarpus sp. 12 AP-2014]
RRRRRQACARTGPAPARRYGCPCPPSATQGALSCTPSGAARTPRRPRARTRTGTTTIAMVRPTQRVGFVVVASVAGAAVVAAPPLRSHTAAARGRSPGERRRAGAPSRSARGTAPRGASARGSGRPRRRRPRAPRGRRARECGGRAAGRTPSRRPRPGGSRQ